MSGHLDRRAFVTGAATLLLAATGGRPARAAVKPSVHVYKSATCGCCRAWVDHLRAHGYPVKAEDLADLASVKRKLGVPAALESCHTAAVDGYTVEGHVPADVIDRLLRERPKVVGIAVPGMPVGSPGMEVPGQPAERYQVVTFDRSGRTIVYAQR